MRKSEPFSLDQLTRVLALRGNLNDRVDEELLRQFLYEFKVHVWNYPTIDHAVEDILPVLAEVEDLIFLGDPKQLKH